jgi:hypothetical protein
VDVQLTYSMSAVVILAQTRSMVIDMMQLTGMDYFEARELLSGPGLSRFVDL